MTNTNYESRATAEDQADEEVIACEECGYQWNTHSQMKRVTCPNCQHKTKRSVVQYLRIERAKCTCSGASSIGEMAELHQQKASHLRELSNTGWELENDPVHDDYARLTYDLTEVGDDGD